MLQLAGSPKVSKKCTDFLHQSSPFLHFYESNVYFFFFLKMVSTFKSSGNVAQVSFCCWIPLRRWTERRKKKIRETKVRILKCFVKNEDRELDKGGKPRIEEKNRMKEEGKCLTKCVLTQRDRHKNR